MGKILLSNSTTIFNKMHESYQKIGFRISFFESEEKRNISCYKKIYIDNENVWYAEDGTAVISVGTFIYKNEIGSKALNLFYRDFQKEGIEARKRADGIFALCIHNKNKDLIFTDIDGKYAIYYYMDDDKYIVSCSYAHIQEYVHMPVNEYAMMEYSMQECIWGKDTPIKNIYRLESDQLLICKENLKVVEDASGQICVGLIEEKSGSIDNLCKYMREKADCYNKLFEKRSVCMTGGLDTRVVLAAMISKQEKSSIISWQGRGHVFNSQLEDRVCCKNISEKCGLPFKTVEFEPFYKMCEDSVYYERMGELAFIYGGNKTYQQLMENGNGSDYMTFGFFGESLRSNDALDKVYHTPFSMEEYVDKFYLKGQYKTFVENWDVYRDYVLKKIKMRAIKLGINIDNMTQKECMLLDYYRRVRCDTDQAKIANIYRYSTLLSGEPLVRLESLRISYNQKSKAHVQLQCIQNMRPDLMEIPVFSHCRYYPINKKILEIEMNAKQEKIIRLKDQVDQLGKQYFPLMYGRLFGFYLKLKTSYNGNSLDNDSMGYYIDYIRENCHNKKILYMLSHLNAQKWDDIAKILCTLVYIAQK